MLKYTAALALFLALAGCSDAESEAKPVATPSPEPELTPTPEVTPEPKMATLRFPKGVLAVWFDQGVANCVVSKPTEWATERAELSEAEMMSCAVEAKTDKEYTCTFGLNMCTFGSDRYTYSLPDCTGTYPASRTQIYTCDKP